METLLLLFILWIGFCLIVALMAKEKGRSAFGFFLCSVFFSPVLGLIIVLIISPVEDNIKQKKLLEGELKKCPFCAEIIKKKAIVCRYCGKDLPERSKLKKNKPIESDPIEETTKLKNQGSVS